MAMPVFVVLFAMQYSSHLKRSHRWAAILLLFVTVFSVYLVPQTGVEKRIEQARVDIERYFDGDLKNNSVGLRFDMWKAAVIMFQNEPFTGVGIRKYYNEQKRMVDNGVVHRDSLEHGHPHNVYLSELASKGLIGFVLLMMIFIYPLRIFFRHMKSSDVETSSLAYAGAALVAGYMLFGLSESMFYRVLPISFYTIFIFTITAFIYSKSPHTTE